MEKSIPTSQSLPKDLKMARNEKLFTSLFDTVFHQQCIQEKNTLNGAMASGREKIQHQTLDDLAMVKFRSKSSSDLRLLYRNWRTGASQGADFSQLVDKHPTEDSANSMNSYTSSHEDLVSIGPVVNASEMYEGANPVDGMIKQRSSFESGQGSPMLSGCTEPNAPSGIALSFMQSAASGNDAFVLGSPDAVLPGIPEKPYDRQGSVASDLDGPLMMDHDHDILESHQQILSAMFRKQTSIGNMDQAIVTDWQNSYSSSYSPNGTPPAIIAGSLDAPGTTLKEKKNAKGGIPKAVSYNALSDLEKSNYFPFKPKTSAIGTQRGLKDSVTNDMCRAVVRQMVGDVYVVSSGKRGKKVINHLYAPLLESVQRHFKRLPARYALSVNPDDVPMHMRLLAKQERYPKGVALHAQWCKHDDGGLKDTECEVVVVATDQDNLLDAITRSLTALKGKILDADVMTTTSGVTLDCFVVGGNFVSEDILRDLKHRIEALLERSTVDENIPLPIENVQSVISPKVIDELAAPTYTEQLGVDKMIGSHEVHTEWKISLSEITLDAPIGVGRSGQTYKAKWRGALVAAKVININRQHQGANASLTDDILNEFYREVALVCRLRHPNVVLFLGASVNPPTYCLVFEYMQNGTLTDLMRSKKGGLPFFRLAKEIALGMNYLHLCSIIHRDLKSANILIDQHGTAKVSDFGLSCVYDLSAATELTAETGTYRWMAPEVIRHEPYTNKADMYSFAVVMWELITKEQPFRGMTPIQAAFAVARQQMRPALPAYTPKKLAELVEHCWHQDPRLRPTFEELLQVLPHVEQSLKKREFSQLGFSN